MITRRSLLSALPITPLAVIPALAASSPQPEGMLRMTLDGRDLLVDTTDIPAVWQVTDEEAPHLKTWTSMPDEHDLYLIIGRHRTLEVSRLWPMNMTWLPYGPGRTGQVEWTEEGKYIRRYGQAVQVIGKVIAG